jgi:hypothetical protein
MFDGLGDAVLMLLCIAAFGVFALASGVGLALWSIWLPITVWQAVPIMTFFGACGAFLASRIK